MNRTLTAKEIIDGRYHGNPNFITPRLVKRGKLTKNIAYEISTGDPLFGEELFGVTIVQYHPDTHTFMRGVESKLTYSRQEAEQYVAYLKDLFRSQEADHE